MVTVAPGTTAPDGSATVPMMDEFPPVSTPVPVSAVALMPSARQQIPVITKPTRLGRWKRRASARRTQGPSPTALATAGGKIATKAKALSSARLCGTAKAAPFHPFFLYFQLISTPQFAALSRHTEMGGTGERTKTAIDSWTCHDR